MQLKNRLFQYPVLSPYSNDYTDEEFELLIEQDLIDETIMTFQINFILSENTLNQWIQSNVASFAVLIDCPKTSYREVFKSQTAQFSIEVAFNSLIDAVKIQGFIILNKDIDNFYSPNFNPLFANSEFTLKRHSVLGVSREYKIDIEPEDEAFKTVTSIFKVIKQTNLNDDEIDINYLSDYIHIFISSNRYREYKEVERLTKQTPQLLHATLVIPVLNSVLLEIKDLTPDEIDFKWFKSMQEIFKEKGLNLEEVLSSDQSKFSLANVLLESPTLKTLEILKNTFTVKADFDEEV